MIERFDSRSSSQARWVRIECNQEENVIPVVLMKNFEKYFGSSAATLAASFSPMGLLRFL
jgi:hypothetical protein